MLKRKNSSMPSSSQSLPDMSGNEQQQQPHEDVSGNGSKTMKMSMMEKMAYRKMMKQFQRQEYNEESPLINTDRKEGNEDEIPTAMRNKFRKLQHRFASFSSSGNEDGGAEIQEYNEESQLINTNRKEGKEDEIPTAIRSKFRNLQHHYASLRSSGNGEGDSNEDGRAASEAADLNENANIDIEQGMQQLQAENEALLSRCRKLESQNIIASAQMLDFYAICLGISVSLLAYGIYVRFIQFIFQKYLDHANIAHEYFMSMGTETETGTYASSVHDGSESASDILFTISIFVWKYIIMAVPYMYNRINYGITYRRFQVFAVAFIFMARVKMTRWRVEKYINVPKENNSDGDGDGLDNDNATRNFSSKRNASQFGEDITEDDVWEGVYEINARFLYASVLRLRGLWTKTAQYLSSRADFVPVAYVRELSKLMDEAPSTSWKDVERMLQKAGIMDDFASIEQEPIASASIGQVHEAKLKKKCNVHDDNDCDTGDGDRKVVIKVQHPHAYTLLTDDFVSLRIIARIVSILEPEYKFVEILMNEWASEARKELDFRTEVENLQLAGASVKDMEDSCSMMTDAVSSNATGTGAEQGTENSDESERIRIPFAVEIPRPFPRLSSSRVMVMSFCEGKRIDDLEQIRRCDVPREAIMNAVSQIFAHQMYVSDVFNGDPHPGNIFIRPGRSRSLGMRKDKVTENFDTNAGFTIVVLDWGLAKRLPDSKRTGFCQMVYAAATFDFGLMMDGFKTLGLKLKREDVAEDMEGIRFLLRDMAPREKARKRVKAKIKTDQKRYQGKKKGEKVPVESKAYPGEFFFFVRTNELLHGLGSRLGVDMKYLDVLRSFAEEGIKKSKLYMLSSNHPDPLLTEVLGDQTLQNKIDNLLHSLELSNDIAGAQVCVVDKVGTTLAHSVRGNMGSLKKHLPLRSDSLLLGFSVTKATAATLANRMVQEGYMSYDEPICERIWPEFCPFANAPEDFVQAVANVDGFENASQRWKWKRSITLRHILTHSAGLYSSLPSKLSIRKLASCETCVEAFEYKHDKSEETILPSNAPGTECIYHYISFGWLVAGCCTGAYFLRHGKRATYEEVYDAICAPLHSDALKKAGFRPCGGGGSHDMAFNDAQVDISRMMQMRREAEAMGEKLETMGLGMNPEQDDPASRRRRELMNGMKGREFIVDPRIWNSEDALNANVPAVGGRFSAKGIAMFYHELSSGKILSSEMLSNATRVAIESDNLQLLQGRTNMINGDRVDGQQGSKFGLGYQIIQLPGQDDGYAFGHAGVGGSIGLHHINSQVSLGIMLNKADGDGAVSKQIIEVISKHLEW